MSKYKVFLGYPETEQFDTIEIEAGSNKQANQIAYYMWLSWGINNDIDGSNYYVKNRLDNIIR